jgi:acetolactate synthase-1/2/3 large subunit
MTSADALTESLLRHGIDTVYGLPGLHSDPLFDAFFHKREQLRVVHTRHEQGSAYMALGAAMATGKPQAFAVVPGPGFLNASAALLTAYGANASVLGVVGQIPQVDIDRGHGHLHEIHDQLGMAAHITKFAARITAPYEAPLLVRDALKAACSGRQRPVVLECAMDTLATKGAVSFPAMPAPLDKAPIDEDLVEQAARLLGAAKRPIIVVGGGALDASAEVIALAEMLEAPVVSYRRGRGVVPSSHRLAVNLPIGYRLWKDADLVVGIGTRLFIQQGSWGLDADIKVVRIDADPLEPDRMHRPAVAMVGDAADYTAALIARLGAHNPKRASREEELAGHRGWMAERFASFEPQVSFLKAIRAALPEDGIFVEDVTQLGFASRLAFDVERPRTFISPGYQDNLGWAYGAALGAAAAKPGTPVVCVAGDGGFMYQVGELATAVQHNLQVVLVVFDNAGFGNVRRIQQERFGGRFISCDLVNPDFKVLAETFGMAGFRAVTPEDLQQALSQAIALKAPALIHVPCGEMPSPWGMIHMPRLRG